MRLKEVRESLAYNQERMAALLGLSRDSYAKKEVGETYPGYTVLMKLGANYDISMDWFLLGRGEMLFKEQAEEKEGKGENEETRGKEGESEALNPEQRELLAHMEKVPLLNHEIMAFYHRFKMQNKELFLPAAEKPTKEK